MPAKWPWGEEGQLCAPKRRSRHQCLDHRQLPDPFFRPSTVTAPVETAQIAPTLRGWLGLDPQSFEAVQLEGTPVLPAVEFGAEGDGALMA